MHGNRLTIDTTVIRDYLSSRRRGHGAAITLFELARRGEVELTTAPQAYRLDAQGDLAAQLTNALAEEGVSSMRQLAYPSSVSSPRASAQPACVRVAC